MTGTEHVWSEITVVHNQWHHLFDALFWFSLGPVFFLQRKSVGVRDCIVAASNQIYPNTKASPLF